MPRQSDNRKQGQADAVNRARGALANQDERRAHRPLEGKTAKSSTHTPPADLRRADQPKSEREEFPAPDLAKSASQDDLSALLKYYGIVAIPMVVYEWGGYRYTNASDAIAAAKRSASA